MPAGSELVRQREGKRAEHQDVLVLQRGEPREVLVADLAAGVLFAATRIGWIPIAFMVPIVLIGAGLCLLHHWTGSLYPGIALHALNNSIPLAAALHWTWPGLFPATTAVDLSCPGAEIIDDRVRSY